MRVRLARLFWTGAAAVLGAAALVAVAAVLRGDFTETDGEILGVLATALLAGGVALAGLALVERGDLRALGWATVLGSLVGFVLATIEITSEFDHERLSLSVFLVLGALLLISTARLMTTDRTDGVFWVAHVLVTVATAGTLAAIWSEPEGDAWAKLLATVWILAGLAWFLVPVLGRLGGTSHGRVERVVARGPGHHEVDLADGELLVVRRG
jgi:hypothetical protein